MLSKKSGKWKSFGFHTLMEMGENTFSLFASYKIPRLRQSHPIPFSSKGWQNKNSFKNSHQR